MWPAVAAVMEYSVGPRMAVSKPAAHRKFMAVTGVPETPGGTRGGGYSLCVKEAQITSEAACCIATGTDPANFCWRKSHSTWADLLGTA